ncbi:hypothetical protein CASFOL_000156 [Castilleja foliolosa]|uniref:Protein BIG GRAIN 1-like B n=1 Tax=Castilleja foliolosa TaxID=1961234 RepID=A0ABD3ENG7_9LAMI
MYTCEKQYRDEKYSKSRIPPKEMPSFSSTLLDQIYRSIDGGAGNSEAHREKPVKKQSSHRLSKTNIIEDEDEMNFRRACLVDKWMEKGKIEKPISKKCPDLELDNKSSLQDNNNDVLFFSSTSSSNSDSSGALSSSDTEFFGPQTKPKVSCFATRPKPVRTGPVPGPARGSKTNPQEHFSLFGDYQNNEKNKSRALKLYANLKKVKQPISPGGRLTSLINSIFNANGKKSKNVDTSKDYRDSNSPKTQSACSTATSFSRSCLSKHSPGSRDKTRDGAQRTVRFHPVIVDDDTRLVYDKRGKPPLPTRDQILDDLKLRKMEKSRKVEEGVRNELKGYNGKNRDDYSLFRKIDGGDGDDDYDGMSDSSSDLFELDHLSLFGGNKLCDELPVYETTRLDTNRSIASRLIR